MASVTTGTITASIGLVAPSPTTRPTGSGTGHSLPTRASGSGSQRFNGSGTGHGRKGTASGSGSNGLPTVWSAGQSLPAGLVMTGSTGRYMMDASGTYQNFGTNVPRLGFVYDAPSGLYVPAWAMECVARTNLALGSNLFGDATSWGSLTGWTVTAATSCIAGQTAWLHTNTGTGGSRARTQTVGVFANGETDCLGIILEVPGSNAADITTISIRDLTAGGTVAKAQLTWATKSVAITVGTGTCGLIPLSNTRYVLYVTATGIAAGASNVAGAGNTRAVSLFATGESVNTQSVVIHHAQFEPNRTLPSTPIVTVGTSVSLAAEVPTLPFALAPQAMTVYTRRLNDRLGAGWMTTGSALWSLSNSGVTAPLLRLQDNGSVDGGMSAQWDNATTSSTATNHSQGALASQIEDRVSLSAAGLTSYGTSIGGAAESVVAAGSSAALVGAFSAPTALRFLASYVALTSLKIALGNPTLAQLRSFV